MDNEIQQIISDLIQTSLTEDQIPFCFIRSLTEYFILRKRRKTLKAVSKVLKSCSDRLLEQYCATIGTSNQNYTQLVACATLESTYQYYKTDYDTVDAMLGEYEIYLMCQGFMDILLFRKRPERNLWDYRRYLG